MSERPDHVHSTMASTAKGLVVLVALALALLIPVLIAGCSKQSSAHYTQDGKPIVRISMYDSTSFPDWRVYVEQQNPDVYIQWEDNRNTCSNVLYQAVHGDMPDIVAIRKFDSDSARALEPYLSDLSGLELTGTFKTKYLEPFQDNGRQYWLPEPGTIEGLWANADIFAQYGIAIPTDMNSYIDACRQLRSHGITPSLVDLKQNWSCVAVLEGYGAAPYLGTDAGLAWRRSFDAGTVSSVDAEGFSRIADTLRMLKDNGILTQEDLDAQTSDVATKLASGQVGIVKKATDSFFDNASIYHFVALPYFGETADDSWLFTYPVVSLSVSKDTESDTVRRDATVKVLGTMMDSSAQNLLAKGTTGLISYNTDIELPLPSSLDNVRSLIDGDRCYIRMLNSNTFPAARAALEALIAKDADDATFVSVLDSKLFAQVKVTDVVTSDVAASNELDANSNSPAASILADMMRQQMSADCAIIDSREATAPIYKGKYTDTDIAAITMASDVYTGDLSKDQIESLVQRCLLYTTTFKQSATEPLIDYPVLSGIKATMDKGGTVDSVTDDTGAALIADRTYHVAISGRVYTALGKDSNPLRSAFSKQGKGLVKCVSDGFTATGKVPQPHSYFTVH